MIVSRIRICYIRKHPSKYSIDALVSFIDPKRMTMILTYPNPLYFTSFNLALIYSVSMNFFEFERYGPGWWSARGLKRKDVGTNKYPSPRRADKKRKI